MLEDTYYVAQILIFIIAIFAATAAWKQFRFNTYFELTKFLQDPKLRSDRRKAYELIDNQTPLKEWTDEDREAVSHVFSSFDVVGMLAKKSLVSMDFFAEFYKDSIVKIHDGHIEFLISERIRKSDDYWGFMKKLYRISKDFKTHARSPKIYRSIISRIFH